MDIAVNWDAFMKVDLFMEFPSPPGHDRGTEGALHDGTAIARAAEAAGIDAVWLAEHHFLGDYCNLAAPDMLLAAIARETKRLRLGFGILPERFPLVTFMRDRPLPLPDAQVLATDKHGAPALFRTHGNCFGFIGHPGAKAGMAEDLIMEFDEPPDGFGETLAEFRGIQKPLEDSLVYIMTGLVQATGWMRQVTGARPEG